MDGRRYLRKHCFRPWRYGFGRVCRALEQTLHPLPAAIPALPRFGVRFAPPAPGPGDVGVNGVSDGDDEENPKHRPNRTVPGGFLVFDPAEF